MLMELSSLGRFRHHFPSRRLKTPRNSAFLNKRIEAYRQRARSYRYFGGEHLFHAKELEQDDILINNNDYLDLARHPSIKQAEIHAINEVGHGIMLSNVFTQHYQNSQQIFQQRLAALLHYEDVMICQSGWCANTGLLPSIADSRQIIYMDLLAHMSLWQGAILAGSKVAAFRHNSVEHLECQLKKYGPGIVVVDSVYSTTGDVSPLREIVSLASQHGCIIVVDESHSLGTHGANGGGIVVGLELSDKVHFITASLAKCFVGRGGIIAGSKRNIEYLRYESRPAIFSSCVLPHEFAGFSAALDIIEKDEWRRIKLHRNADYLRCHLDTIGYNINRSQSQIIALESGPEKYTFLLRKALEKHGIIGSVFCAPATPKNRSMIRFSLNSGLTIHDLNHIVAVCDTIKEEVYFDKWPSTQRLRRRKHTKVNMVRQSVDNVVPLRLSED